MSNAPQGPGWWQATDQRWYPPELHPQYSSPQAAGFQQVSGSGPALPVDEPLESKDLLRSLFDFSFSSFVTLRVIRILYILITILLTLGAVVGIAGALIKHTAADIVVGIIVIPIVYLVYLTFTRIGMEIIMVLFHLGKDVHVIRERNQQRAT